MSQRRILVAWIGDTDIRSMASQLDDEKRTAVLTALERPRKRDIELGPIRTLVQQEAFERVHLISDRPEWLNDLFCEWLQCKPVVHPVQLNDPTDYESVLNAARVVFEKAWKANRQAGLCIHLSPGTPTMTATSVLLGKTIFPAVFFQTFDGRVVETHIPFDIVEDCVRNLFREPDRRLQEWGAHSPKDVEGFGHIKGESRAIRIAVGKAEKIALRDVNVLITGESGTGKELFARAIHTRSARRKANFVVRNCAAIPREFFESDLFGIKPGTATGVEGRSGAFEEADGGVLFLDEVGELSLDNQAKLLRALQPKHGGPPCNVCIRRVGEPKDEKIFSVRIIAATNRNLLECVDKGTFRADLYYRLARITIELPPLRTRKSDIRVLAESHLESINREFCNGKFTQPGYEVKSIDESGFRKLKEYDWPGNVRELTNVLDQAAILTDDSVLTKEDIGGALPDSQNPRTHKSLLLREPGETINLSKRLDEIEKLFIQDALDDAGNVQAKAAALLEESPQNLAKKIRRLEIKSSNSRRSKS